MENTQNKKEQNTEKKTPLSSRLFEAAFTETKGMFGLGNQKAYNADEVDVFLTDAGEEAEEMEKFTKKLYNYYLTKKEEEKKAPKKSNVNEHRQSSVEKESAVNTHSQPPLKNDRSAKMQKHMTELLMIAENRAEEVIKQAELEAEDLLKRANKQAQEITQTASEESSEIKKKADERMKSASRAKQEVEQRAQEIKKNFEKKAIEIENFGENFGEMANKIRQVINH